MSASTESKVFYDNQRICQRDAGSCDTRIGVCAVYVKRMYEGEERVFGCTVGHTFFSKWRGGIPLETEEIVGKVVQSGSWMSNIRVVATSEHGIIHANRRFGVVVQYDLDSGMAEILIEKDYPLNLTEKAVAHPDRNQELHLANRRSRCSGPACGRVAVALFPCSRCQCEFYCSLTCQTQDRPYHRKCCPRPDVPPPELVKSKSD